MLTSKRVRVYGPPGTGKTTWLVTQVEELLNRGVPGEEIAIASFSRAAFREFSRRISGRIPEENLGTIHSLAYRAINRPELALTPAALKDWNKQAPDVWQITPRIRGAGEAAFDAMDPYDDDEAPPGDQLYDQVVFLRNTLVPVAQWPEKAREFWNSWRAWMRQEGLIDFPGMLEAALLRPGLGVDYLYVDEAQDLTPLQLALVEHWAASTRYLALIGDDDQAIYEFMGANGSSFLAPQTHEEIVLSQSYRVPAMVQSLAEEIAGRISHRARKRYRARSEYGEVEYLPVSPESPNWAAEHAIEREKSGQSVLFLATARYLLEPLKGELLERGIPWGNPYAPQRSSFNIFPATRGGAAAWEKARSFLFPKRVGSDLKAWAKHVVSDVFGRGNKTHALEAINALPDEGTIGDNHPIWQEFLPSHRQHALERNPGWLLDHLLGNAPRGMRNALMVALRNPQAILEGRARVWLGTIHSVKGGEADWVYVWPGYTRRAARAHPDTLHRLMYVAVTRARRGVVLLGEGMAPHAYGWPSKQQIWQEVEI
jgi:DNA helicase-2/ATP-dependent DNA helicase PcrA